MGLKLYKLQAKDKQAQKTRTEYLKGCDNIDDVLHHQSLPYIPEIIQTKLISKYHNNLLAGHFGIKKTHELVAQKYYWILLCHNVKDYVKRCDVYLALKAVQHKLYGDLQSLPIPTYC